MLRFQHILKALFGGLMGKHVGVYPHGDRWIAQITAMGKKYYSGLCNSIEEAISARKELERNYWGAV